MHAIELIVGLGNPGSRYQDTRHNAGFWLVESVADRSIARFKDDSRMHGRVAETSLGGARLRFLLPDTYMNHSGRAVRAMAQFYKIPTEAILVVHDDLDLPSGTVRLKRGGGHGGHNGLRDIIAQLGSRDFARIRLGVGHPGVHEQVVDHVLRKPGKEERQQIDAAIDAAIDELDNIVAGKFDPAMNRLHSR